MKIVILDGQTINPGDLSWEALRPAGELKICAGVSPTDDPVPHIGDADAVLVSKVPITAQVMDACPNLKYIGVLATGYNVIDLEAARARSLAVTNVPAYGTPAVSQHIFALLLDLACRVTEHHQAVQRGDWCRCANFCFWNSPLIELAGKTLCVYGFGQIGRQTARIAQAFDMRVLAVPHHPERAPQAEGVTFVDRETAFREADALALCCPLNAETDRLVNTHTLSLMKPTAFLINTARGGLCDEQAIADALNAGRLGGFGADVVTIEPMQPDNPLLRAKNCILTPHIAWAPKETRERLIGLIAENLLAYCKGERKNRIV